MHYAVKNKRLQEQFEQAKLKAIKAKIDTINEKENINPLEAGNKDTYTSSEFKGFGAIFKGGR